MTILFKIIMFINRLFHFKIEFYEKMVDIGKI